MKKSEYVKEKIIDVTIELINNSSGKTQEITTRMIAERAGVGVGLINYHFESKDELIEICVQKIISNVIASFHPEIDQELTPVERLKLVTKLVSEFLLDHPSVSRISMLGDYSNPKPSDNTMKTVRGFSYQLSGLTISEEKKQILLFCLTSILQSSFLRKDISKECLGVDFNRKEERESYIDQVIDQLFSEKN